MIQDLEDDYPEYLEDELGYAWDAWDIVAAKEIKAHDAIRAMPLDRLASIDPAGLSDLERWALATASARLGDSEGHLEAVRLILSTPDEHPAIDYFDVHVVAIDATARAGLFDEALLHLAAARKRWPEDATLDRVEAILAIRRDVGGGRAVVQRAIAEHAEDSEFLFELMEDLVTLGLHDLAREALPAAKSAAERHATATLVDIELLEVKLSSVPPQGSLHDD